ncbi:MAG: DNA methyltransferase [Chitinophagales bacterium]
MTAISNKKVEEYVTVKEKIPLQIPKNTVFNINTQKVTTLTHGFHKYPAKYIPQIPRWAIQKYAGESIPKLILDPFCGSGTTLVESLVNGQNSIGIDIDPLSVLISKVKTTKVNPTLLHKIADWVILEIQHRKKGNFSPDCETIEHWFTKEAIHILSIIRTVIDEVPVKFGEEKEVKDIQDLLLICFSSIIRKVSNADNESQKTYVSHTKIKTPEEPTALFLKKLQLFQERIVAFSKRINDQQKSTIIHTNSSKPLTNHIASNSIDLAITSPPYIKAIDYIYNQMAELFWIGDLFDMQTQSQQNQKKKKYIGTKHIHKPEYASYSPLETLTDSAMLNQILHDIYTFDPKNGHKHAYLTYRYFSEMRQHFQQMNSVLKNESHYVMVVGNSNVSSVFIDTANILIEIAEKEGFQLVNLWGYKIKNRYMRFDRKGRGGIIKMDWVMDFVKG